MTRRVKLEDHDDAKDDLTPTAARYPPYVHFSQFQTLLNFPSVSIEEISAEISARTMDLKPQLTALSAHTIKA